MVVCLILGQKDCDLPKSYSYNQLPNAGSSEPGGGRLNVTGGLCEPHNLHQDQVKLILSNQYMLSFITDDASFYIGIDLHGVYACVRARARISIFFGTFKPHHIKPIDYSSYDKICISIQKPKNFM